MKVNLSFEFNTNEEAETFLRTVRERAAVHAELSAAPEAEPAPQRRAKKGKAKEQIEIPDPLLNPKAATCSADDVQKKVEAVFAKEGMHTARDLLSRFDATRVRDLPPSKYDAVVALADKILAGELP